MGKIVPSLDKTCRFRAQLVQNWTVQKLEVQMYLCLAKMTESIELKGHLADNKNNSFS